MSRRGTKVGLKSKMTAVATGSLVITVAAMSGFLVDAPEPQLNRIDAGVASGDLEEIPGLRTSRWPEDEAQFDKEELARQVMVSRCMQRLNHIYTPSVSERIDSATLTFREPTEDPNMQHAATLSPAERETYFVALYGVPDPYSQVQPPPLLPNCSSEASASLPGLYALPADLQEKLDHFRESLRSEPRIVAADERLLTCAGVDRTGPRAVEVSILLDGAMNNTAAVSEEAGSCIRTYSDDVKLVSDELSKRFIAENEQSIRVHLKSLEEQSVLLAEFSK